MNSFIPLLAFPILILLIPFSAAQTPISCAFCIAGVGQINQQVLTATPDVQAQMGLQASQGCDQIPVQQVRQACRLTMNDHFNAFYSVC
uniref:Saposin B-type domain-containing protein n=1 Tax=Caenorhabditis japonica TaxID=281687 RepID=A0A8R1DYL5_CAEJA